MGKKKVLDVGQCDFDHGNISSMLNREFDVDIQRAHMPQDALELAKETEFDLILINRLFDRDRSEGTELLRQLKEEAATSKCPVMIVSNLEQAQIDAQASGAVKGFGKAKLDEPSTRELLAAYLA